jgi:two-component system sensor histidine kinase MprB
MSLRLRIALLMATLAAVATIAVGAISYQTTSSRLLRAVDDSLVDATAVATAQRFDERLFDSGPFDGVVVQAILKDGSVLRSNFPKPMKPNREDLKLIGRAGVTNFRSTQLGRAEYRIRSIGFEDGIIQIGRPLVEMNAVLESLRLRTLLLVTGVTLAAGALGAVVAGRVTRPLRVLTDAASEIESTGRLELVDGDRLEGRDEVGRLSTAFHRMIGALARSRADQRRLVEDAGHELRTPVTSIRTGLDTLSRYPDLPADERAEIVESMRAEASELTSLVNEVVQVASGEVDDSAPDQVRVGDVVTAAAERSQRRSGRQVLVQSDDSEVIIRRGQLERAVSNLLENAVKFDQTDGPIEVTVVDGRISVLDRGPGIPIADQPLVFERFHRSATARTLPGSGLGLSMVASTARQHGGEVFVADRDGGGAVVGLTLPVVRSWDPPSV